MHDCLMSFLSLFLTETLEVLVHCDVVRRVSYFYIDMRHKKEDWGYHMEWQTTVADGRGSSIILYDGGVLYIFVVCLL